MTVNVLFVHGAGPNAWFGGALEGLRAAVVGKFGAKVYVPRAIDYTEYNTLVRLLNQWNDPTVLVGLSCGNKSITRAAAELSMEKIPYLMACSPSMYCGMTPLPPNVQRATQVTSWWGDIFNPGSRMLLKKSSVNGKTELDRIDTGYGHTASPGSPVVVKRLLDEIDLASRT